MTDTNPANRPASLASAWGALVQSWPVLLAVVLLGAWLIRLESKTDNNGVKLAEIAAGNTERDARWLAEQKAQNDRVDRIEESRSSNLQRLATVEEGLKGQRDILRDISSKLDRALMGRLAR